MVGQYPTRQIRVVLLVLVTAASVAMAAKGGHGNNQGGGGTRPSGPSTHAAGRGGAQASKPSGHSGARGNSGGGAKTSKPSGYSGARGNSGGGAKTSKPSGRSDARGNSGGGAKTSKPSGHSSARGNSGDYRPSKPSGRSDARGSTNVGHMQGKWSPGSESNGKAAKDRPGKRMTGSFGPPRGGYTAWRSRTEAVHGRPVFTERVVGLSQHGGDCGWHYGWRNKPAKPVVIRTPHYVWHEAMYVPVREPFTQMGCQVSFWGGNLGAALAYANREVIVVRDSPEVIVVESGIAYPVYWQAPPVIHEREIYVPVRPAATTLGLGVAGSGSGLTIAGGFSFSSTW